MSVTVGYSIINTVSAFSMLSLVYLLIFMYSLHQVEVLMTPPRIEHVRTAQSRVTLGEHFQVFF